MIAPPLPAPLGYVAWGAGVALFAGIVRGFAGFGLSAFIVAGMSLLLSPQQIVPAAMMLEILASLSLLRSVWRDVAWHWIGPLLAGYAVAVPLGVWCLATLAGGAAARRRVGRDICRCADHASRLASELRDTIALRLGTGLGSGFLSGLSSIGGMFAATMLFTTSLPGARFRATLITLFFVSAWYGLAWTWRQGLATGAHVLWAAWLLVPMLVGIAIGRRFFARTAEAQFRRAVLRVLAGVAGLGIVRSLWRVFLTPGQSSVILSRPVCTGGADALGMLDASTVHDPPDRLRRPFPPADAFQHLLHVRVPMRHQGHRRERSRALHPGQSESPGQQAACSAPRVRPAS